MVQRLVPQQEMKSGISSHHVHARITVRCSSGLTPVAGGGEPPNKGGPMAAAAQGQNETRRV